MCGFNKPLINKKMKSSNLVSKEKIEKNQIKSMDKFNNLKADYFLEKVFNNLETKKSLYILKYNKVIKNRLNININDYKKYSEKYSSIEIEIKAVNNEYDKFINYKNEDEKYYHIYFDNKKEEIKRNYINEDEDIKIIKIKIDYQVESFERLFEYCDCIESIYFKKFSRNKINNMSFMFSDCSSLKELKFNNFKTINVINMCAMFNKCSSLTELNLNNFNTTNVANMSAMFSDCLSLKELNINNFNTTNLKYAISMFHKCSSLIELNINNFNKANGIVMDDMFSQCPNELITKIKTRYKNIKDKAFNKTDCFFFY